MSCLQYHAQTLFMEQISLPDLAKQYGTPCYIYSRAAIENNWQAFAKALHGFPHKICFAVKANANLAVLNLLARLGSGFDIVSEGELERVLAAGGDARKIVFSGVGKQRREMQRALQANIFCFNIESEIELERLNTLAQEMHTTASIALRVNPNIQADTHAYITTGSEENKFGIAADKIIPICQTLARLPHLKLIGLACHIGSQLVDITPFQQALDCLLNLYAQLKTLGITLTHIDMGGGLGITYKNENPPAIETYVQALRTRLQAYPLELILEPGRAIAGNAGILLTRIEFLKQTSRKNFAIVDAGMTDLLRPALYNAWHDILPVQIRAGEKKRYEITGPICESGDFLGKDRDLILAAGDLLAIGNVGAYGFCLSSNYNARPRAPEILVDGKESYLIRRRETIQDLFAIENISSTSLV